MKMVQEILQLSDLFGIELSALLEEDDEMNAVDFALAFRSDEVTNDDLKQVADLFSVNRLMPEEGILMRIPEAELAKDKIKIGTILELEQTFGVLHQVFLYRLKSFGIVSQSFLDENKNDINREML